MAPTRDKWVRRFIIPETTRHKKGFTIYKVTSVVFLKSSHEEISKVSVWKRYNDFKKLHSELSILCSRSQIKEAFPLFPKPKFFGRFETEVIEERRECALKFLEFIGRHSYLYSSDIFIKFFETSHADYCLNDCSQSLSSDTSAEDDHHACINSVPPNGIVSKNILQPKSIQAPLINPPIPKDEINQPQDTWKSKEQFSQLNDLENERSIKESTCNSFLVKDDSLNKITSKLEDNQLVFNKNNNLYKDKNHNVKNGKDSTVVQTSSNNVTVDSTPEELNFSIIAHDGSDLPQSWPESSQYILVAAAHMSAAFRHEDLMEYEEAFTQYKMGISSLRSGVESDSNKIRAGIIKDKISKYLERAEKLYNRYLNCNVSLLSKPISELQYYKVLKVMKSVMLVKDIRQNCLNIVKTVEKLSTNKENISDYILRGQIPYMVRLHACVETETTIFLILQHLNRGKLWDFITSHYNTNNNKIITGNTVAETIDDNNVILRKSDVQNDIKNSIIKKNSNFISTNPKVQMEEVHSVIDENYSDVSTTQLLEKAQILLQSVNATLKESNSVVNRLCESDRLINHQGNTSLLNLKNSVHRSKSCKEIPLDINDISLKIDDVNDNFKKQNISEESVITSNYSTLRNIKNTKSQCSTNNSSLSNSDKNLNFDERGSNDSSTGNLKTIDTYFAVDSNCIDSVAKHEVNDTIEICNKTEINNYYVPDDQQIPYSDMTLLIDSTESNNDDEQELWTIPENVIRLWAAEILLALEALHQQKVIIFDLKPDNILLDDNGHVQLTYFIPRHDVDLLKYKYPYSSPELYTFSPIIPLTPATDIWSFGVILYELIVGNKFEEKHPGVFQPHSMINIPGKLSENAKSLLLNILKYEPNERMTIPEIKEHPFFKDINWSSLVNT
ncbi:ribosomal protein S6 kinase-like 1 [Megachile rotundata]|uniref:ribosomal protein S6 kinase-like 1 n=1 Tax=Megachile rotundata TaxID=143995 RepID=UPI000258D462|nr:PREDICTED: ribosomal protein S6 kinase delta-1 [Megachile rotundata]